MTKTEFALAYKKCTNKELRQFIETRDLSIRLDGRNNRKAAIRDLLKADRDATFRFLDLPPEMRNIVYRELLTLRTREAKDWRCQPCSGDVRTCEHKSRFCWPLILVACRQVQGEAQDILNEENEMAVTLHVDSVPRTAHRTTILIPTLKVNGRTHGLQTFQPESLPASTWPPYLLKARHVHISFTLGHNHLAFLDRVLFRDINRALHHLCFYLEGNQSLEQIKISVKNNRMLNDSVVDLLYPLTLFGTKAQFHLQGAPAVGLKPIEESGTKIHGQKINVYHKFANLRDTMRPLLKSGEE